MRQLELILVIALGAAIPFSAGVAKTQATQAPAAGARPRADFDPALLHPETLKEKAPESYRVKFTTTKGDFVVEVTRAWAPLGADRFYLLATHSFYEGATYFRVLPGFVTQFGISAHPNVSQVWRSATIKDDPVKKSNRRGTLSFATGGPNTRTTQVFINLADNSRLDGMGFSPFGEVVEGMSVVEKLYSGYGEGAPQGRGPRQDLIEAKGKPYLDKEFPLLDSAKATTVIVPVAKKPATASRPQQEQ